MAVNKIGEYFNWNEDFTRVLSMGAGMFTSNKTSNGLVSLDKKFNISGDFPSVQLTDRSGYGHVKETVPFLSDYFEGADSGINRGFDEATFYSVKNKNGGEIYVSTDTILQKHFEDIVNNSKGKVNVLTGAHGDVDGQLLPYIGFYEADYKRWGNNHNVNVININDLSSSELSSILNSDSINICAWCYSERSEKVLKALELI